MIWLGITCHLGQWALTNENSFCVYSLNLLHTYNYSYIFDFRFQKGCMLIIIMKQLHTAKLEITIIYVVNCEGLGLLLYTMSGTDGPILSNEMGVYSYIQYNNKILLQKILLLSFFLPPIHHTKLYTKMFYKQRGTQTHRPISQNHTENLHVQKLDQWNIRETSSIINTGRTVPLKTVSYNTKLRTRPL